MVTELAPLPRLLLVTAAIAAGGWNPPAIAQNTAIAQNSGPAQDRANAEQPSAGWTLEDALAQSEEFAYIRTLMPAGAAEEDGWRRTSATGCPADSRPKHFQPGVQGR